MVEGMGRRGVRGAWAAPREWDAAEMPARLLQPAPATGGAVVGCIADAEDEHREAQEQVCGQVDDVPLARQGLV